MWTSTRSTQPSNPHRCLSARGRYGTTGRSKSDGWPEKVRLVLSSSLPGRNGCGRRVFMCGRWPWPPTTHLKSWICQCLPLILWEIKFPITNQISYHFVELHVASAGESATMNSRKRLYGTAVQPVLPLARRDDVGTVRQRRQPRAPGPGVPRTLRADGFSGFGIVRWLFGTTAPGDSSNCAQPEGVHGKRKDLRDCWTGQCYRPRRLGVSSDVR